MPDRMTDRVVLGDRYVVRAGECGAGDDRTATFIAGFEADNPAGTQAETLPPRVAELFSRDRHSIRAVVARCRDGRARRVHGRARGSCLCERASCGDGCGRAWASRRSSVSPRRRRAYIPAPRSPWRSMPSAARSICSCSKRLLRAADRDGSLLSIGEAELLVRDRLSGRGGVRRDRARRLCAALSTGRRRSRRFRGSTRNCLRGARRVADPDLYPAVAGLFARARCAIAVVSGVHRLWPGGAEDADVLARLHSGDSCRCLAGAGVCFAACRATEVFVLLGAAVDGRGRKGSFLFGSLRTKRRCLTFCVAEGVAAAWIGDGAA